MQNVLVTGGAGYIGSHAVLGLIRKGFQVVVLDNLVYGHREIVEKLPGVHFYQGDIGDYELVSRILKEHKIDLVMHFSAYAYVGESVQNPRKYYHNNLESTIRLLDAMLDCNVKKIIFSSTCATYGIPDKTPITEDMPQNPINPYGFTKLAVEHLLKDYGTAYNLKSVIFRYFNAAGADPEVRSGELHDPETHLIPLVLRAADPESDFVLKVYGGDYPTPDGSCIRDYVHVTDLAEAHLLGAEYLLNGGESNQFNLGTECGSSVLEVIKAVETVTGRRVRRVMDNRRPGDPPALVGSSQKARKILHWKPQFTDLRKTVEHAVKWYEKQKRSK